MSYEKSLNAPFSLGNDLNAAGSRFYNPSSPENLYGGLEINVRL
jgi:hypothetical protein